MRAVAAVCAAAAAPARGDGFPPPPPPPPPPPGQAEVLVIGAGWAGMAAAVELAKAGVTFKVLEATNRTGGRTKAVQFGDPAVWQGYMEEGSEWICGCQAGSTNPPNPVCALANSVKGFGMHVDDYQEVAYNADGTEGDVDGKVRTASDAAIDCITALATKSRTSDTETVRQGLTSCGWTPKTGVELAYDWLITVDEAGMPAEDQSLKMEFGARRAMVLSRIANASAQPLRHTLRRPARPVGWRGKAHIRAPRYDGDWQFVTNQNPRGYAQLIDVMTKDTVPPGDKRVLFNQHVRKISYGSSGVSATTADGTVHKAAAAIVTIPYGVLVIEHNTMFEPALPKKLTKIFDAGHMIMTNETKAIIQFPTVFWDNDVNQFVAAPQKGGKGVGDFCEFLNMNHKDNMPGSNTLLAFLGDPESSKYEAMDDASVQKAMLAKLATMYPKATIPTPTAFHLTRWGQSPYARGSYCGFHAGFDDDDYETLMTPPLKKVLYLAGEAMCDDMSGFTHGGRQSGVENAGAYLHDTGRVSKKPKNLCWA